MAIRGSSNQEGNRLAINKIFFPLTILIYRYCMYTLQILKNGMQMINLGDIKRYAWIIQASLSQIKQIILRNPMSSTNQHKENSYTI